MFTIKQLQAFIEATDCSTRAQAGANLDITERTIHQRLVDLQSVVGKLSTPYKRKLNQRGEKFLPLAKELVELWDGRPIDTDQIEALVAVADHGGLQRAADAMHLTSNGVRNRIWALERQLEMRLYVKHMFTPDGVECLKKARRTIEIMRQIEDLK